MAGPLRAPLPVGQLVGCAARRLSADGFAFESRGRRRCDRALVFLVEAFCCSRDRDSRERHRDQAHRLLDYLALAAQRFLSLISRRSARPSSASAVGKNLTISRPSCMPDLVPHELDLALVLVQIVRVVQAREVVVTSGHRRTSMGTSAAHACFAACAA
eukprot:6187218-Pleurochrysis_carterae.AAC.2